MSEEIRQDVLLIRSAALRHAELQAAQHIIGDPDRVLSDLDQKFSIIAPAALAAVIAFTASAGKTSSINFTICIISLALATLITFLAKGFLYLHLKAKKDAVVWEILRTGNDNMGAMPDLVDFGIRPFLTLVAVSLALLILAGIFFIFGFLFA